MSITAVTGSTTNATWQTQQSDRGHGVRRKAFDAAAQALGMSTSDLRSALKSGQSMTSLAQSKGVSTDTLTSAISNALSSADSSLSTDKATEIAQRIVAGPQRGHGGPDGPPPGGKGGPPPAIGAAMDSLASTLGISSDELTSSLQSGKSLTDVAAAQGMDADTLRTTLTSALTKADTSLSADQAGALADKLIAGPAQHRHEHQFSRLAFDNQLNQSASSSAPAQAAVQATYGQYSAAATTSQLASTL
ncbi:hypothetical protein [Krasilnikovia sp. MM14-A1259]|uniref:hypothetical protein n=1 Tax=Krasilnikovia sp. MM14-A1259 TaxID=3373539 RepID=UPI00399D099E